MRISRTILPVALLLAACASEPPPAAAPDELTGVIVEIDARGLDDVRSFTLRSEGETYEILIDDEIDYGFPLSHLNAHRAGADPVLVDLEERDGGLYALSIEDG
ncbi:MAG: hypothetical protein ABR505_11025 [Actinomycetota bacterium]